MPSSRAISAWVRRRSWRRRRSRPPIRIALLVMELLSLTGIYSITPHNCKSSYTIRDFTAKSVTYCAVERCNALVDPATGATDMTSPEQRFAGIRRDYSPEDVERLRGTVTVEHTLAKMGARRLWQLLHDRKYVPSLG